MASIIPHDLLVSDLLHFDDDLIMPDKPVGLRQTHKDAARSSTSRNSSGGGSSNGSSSVTVGLCGELGMGNANFNFANVFGGGDGDISELLTFNSQSSPFIGEMAAAIGSRSNSSSITGDLETEEDDFDLSLDSNLAWPLSRLRPMIAKRLGEAYASLPFWLSMTDSAMEDSSSLSEQCTTDKGQVTVKLSISNGRIVIVDVLSQSASDEIPHTPSPKRPKHVKEEPFDEYSYDDDDVNVTTTTGGDGEGESQFMESIEFLRLREEKQLPVKMSQWTETHTREWIRWVRHTFVGVRMDTKDWSSLDGRHLVSMSYDSFRARVRNDHGNKLWTHFEQLRTTGSAVVPVELESSAVYSPTPSSTSSPAAAAKKVKKPKVILGKYEQGNIFMNIEEGSGVNRTGNNGISTHLWKFLLEILTDRNYRQVIHWVTGSGCEEGEFLMKEPETVARLWGKRKSKENMNYEKLSRALRYYKGGAILDKVKGKRFTYRFVCDLRQLVGYSAHQLDQLVRA